MSTTNTTRRAQTVCYGFALTLFVNCNESATNATPTATGGTTTTSSFATTTGGVNATTSSAWPLMGGATATVTNASRGGSSSKPESGTTTSMGGNSTGGSSYTASATSMAGTTAAGGMSTSGGTTGLPNTSVADATIVPDSSWTCGMPSGIPAPGLGKLVFTATLQVAATHDVGDTEYGHRRILDIKSGTFTGDRIKGTFLAGGFSFELTLSNGSVELEEINVLRTSDNTPIYLRSCGVAPASDSTVRFVPDFEVASSSPYVWLNTGKFVGTRNVDATNGTIKLDVYDVADAPASTTNIQLKDPAGVPNQPTECATATGTKGTSVFTETVTLGSSISIGASKRGTRNIIPITGGTTSGRVVGTIVSGGGDYQLIGTTTTLDARYVLATNDGEFVLVRNCGTMNALVPQFETRVAGSYAFLNNSKYLSSAPGSAAGGVSITFYEQK